MSDLSFIHIPKTGGTSVEDQGKMHGVHWGRHNQINTDTKSTCSFWHVPGRQDSTNIKTTFCVVRDPYDRIKSEYGHRNKKTREEHITPENFNHFVKENLREAKRNSDVNNCHLRPQTEYTRYCDHVLRFENLESDFNNLMNKYGHDDIRLKIHANQSKLVSQKISTNNLDCESIAMINQFYAKDFDELRYPKKRHC